MSFELNSNVFWDDFKGPQLFPRGGNLHVSSFHFGPHDKFKGTKSTRLNTRVVTFDLSIYI